MKVRLERELINLYGREGVVALESIKAMAAAFSVDSICMGRDLIWTPETNVQKLYFNTKGVLAEFSRVDGKMFCQQIITPYRFFWSEKSFLMWEPSDTTMVCLKPSTIYSLDGEQVRKITHENNLGFLLANGLTRENIKGYRIRSRNLSLLNATERLNDTLATNPRILDQLNRNELASYLGLSRSSVFRLLHTLYRGKE